MRVDDLLASRFKCCKCKSTGGLTKRFAAPGTGLTRILDIQHNRYVSVSCRNCGYTEIYDPQYLEGKSHLGDIMDVLFG